MTVESERRRIEVCQVINHDMTMDDDIGIHLLGDGGQGTPFTLLWLCCEEGNENWGVTIEEDLGSTKELWQTAGDWDAISFSVSKHKNKRHRVASAKMNYNKKQKDF